MKFEKIKSIYKRIKKCDSANLCLLMLVCNIVFALICVFCLNNSSLAVREKDITEIVSGLGKSIHVRYDLSDKSEAAKYSLYDPINTFNNNRINELGRNASYIYNINQNIECGSAEGECGQVIYAYKYNYGFTLSRFALVRGDYNEFENKNSIYISMGILEQLGLEKDNAIGHKIKLSTYGDYEFEIRGVLSNSSKTNSSLHFEALFGENYVLINDSFVYEHGYTDLFYLSDNYNFVSDTISFRKAINKSYLNYTDLNAKCSYLDENSQILTNSFDFKRTANVGEVFISIASLIGILICLLVYLVFLSGIELKEETRLIKVLIPLILILWSSLQIGTPILLKSNNIFISKASIVASIIFSAVTLLSTLARFSFFRKTDDKTNGKNDQ